MKVNSGFKIELTAQQALRKIAEKKHLEYADVGRLAISEFIEKNSHLVGFNKYEKIEKFFKDNGFGSVDVDAIIEGLADDQAVNGVGDGQQYDFEDYYYRKADKKMYTVFIDATVIYKFDEDDLEGCDTYLAFHIHSINIKNLNTIKIDEVYTFINK